MRAPSINDPGADSAARTCGELATLLAHTRVLLAEGGKEHMVVEEQLYVAEGVLKKAQRELNRLRTENRRLTMAKIDTSAQAPKADDVLFRLRSGESAASVARRTGWPYTEVLRLAHTAGISLANGRRVDVASKRMALDLLAAGVPQGQVARRLKVSLPTIRKWKQEAELQGCNA